MGLAKGAAFFNIGIYPWICIWHVSIILFNNLPKAFYMTEFSLFLNRSGHSTISKSLKILPLSIPALKRTLSPFLLWGLGVGYVISGMYFGWNLGLEEGGTVGLAIATFFIIILYITFTFSYAELAAAIPKAGGAFDYAHRALGKDLGFIAGMAQNIEFIFAPPAIAFAIGAYFNLFFPQIPILAIAIFAYIVFTALNIYGVKAAAIFELVITIFAVGELLLFTGITIPHFELKNLQHNAFPHGWQGIFAAIPFAIWFFLGIEGVANVAEEAIHPQRTLLLGFGSAILTLVILCVLTFISSIGVAGWEAIVYKADGSHFRFTPATGSGTCYGK